MNKVAVGIFYLCDGKQCGDMCDTECSHTSNIEHALHKNDLRSCLFKPFVDEGGNIMSFVELGSKED